MTNKNLIEVVAREMDRLGYGHHESHARSILCAIHGATTEVPRQPDAIIEGVMTSVGITHAIYASTVSLKDKEQVKLYTSPCCSCCNGSGYERVLGRDNSEIVIDCSICSASPMVERQDVIGTLRRVGQVIVFDAIGDPHIKDGMEVFASPAALKKTGD